MLRVTSPTGSSIVSQSLINIADEDKIDKGESGGNKTNLSKLSVLKKSTKTDYLISKSAKRGGSNTKKDVKAAKNFDYLIPGTKKIFNLLWHMFT